MQEETKPEVTEQTGSTQSEPVVIDLSVLTDNMRGTAEYAENFKTIRTYFKKLGNGECSRQAAALLLQNQLLMYILEKHGIIVKSGAEDEKPVE